jgi:hypothetical protein
VNEEEEEKEEEKEDNVTVHAVMVNNDTVGQYYLKHILIKRV